MLIVYNTIAMVLKEVKDVVAKANIINFAAGAAIFLFLFLAYTHMTMAAQAANPLEAFKDVLLWVVPIILNILATYGIVKAKNGT